MNDSIECDLKVNLKDQYEKIALNWFGYVETTIADRIKKQIIILWKSMRVRIQK